MNPNSKQKRIAFGYQRLANNRIAIHEGQAATLQLIYRLYAEGKSLAEIKAIMEGMNIPSPQTSGLGESKQCPICFPIRTIWGRKNIRLL